MRARVRRGLGRAAHERLLDYALIAAGFSILLALALIARVFSGSYQLGSG